MDGDRPMQINSEEDFTALMAFAFIVIGLIVDGIYALSMVGHHLALP
jgi:hypothetical protein